ncbi:hypothetical protein A7E78_09745 [Syntrophotalea acetylenivorans]|uniref:HTH LytTR-type domain-containing protein n=1 Tax=Syntrophotalea acetylenivorans TaxID=1842532 RepID=A0A1L3GR27_9BACT|nr:PAS domain-containing transcriptional regulator [Syntrophotalea acetylenivorans]APG28098.1 hypothetical protein A7E78_09745 [Syntrophotalea acetylenivorans]
MDHHNLPNLLERMDPGIVLFDNDFRVHHVNQALMQIFTETSRKEIFDQSLLQMHQGPPAERMQELVGLMRDSSRQVSFSIKRMSGGPRDLFLLLKLMPLLDRTLDNSLHCCLVYDITTLIANPQRRFIKVPVTAGGEIQLLDPEEILFIKAENVYSQVAIEEGEFFCDLSLGVLEAGLNQERFFRIHRSYLVNLDRVEKVIREGNTVTLLMAGNACRLPVSRNRAKDFLVRVGLK